MLGVGCRVQAFGWRVLDVALQGRKNVLMTYHSRGQEREGVKCVECSITENKVEG